MTRTQKKLLPRRTFGYPVLICIDFGDLTPSFSPHLMISSRSYIKHTKECLIRYFNTSKWVKKNLAVPHFSTTSLCLDILMKHPFWHLLQLLLYYIKIVQGSHCLYLIPLHHQWNSFQLPHTAV